MPRLRHPEVPSNGFLAAEERHHQGEDVQEDRNREDDEHGDHAGPKPRTVNRRFGRRCIAPSASGSPTGRRRRTELLQSILEWVGAGRRRKGPAEGTETRTPFGAGDESSGVHSVVAVRSRREMKSAYGTRSTEDCHSFATKRQRRQRGEKRGEEGRRWRRNSVHRWPLDRSAGARPAAHASCERTSAYITVYRALGPCLASKLLDDRRVAWPGKVKTKFPLVRERGCPRTAIELRSCFDFAYRPVLLLQRSDGRTKPYARRRGRRHDALGRGESLQSMVKVCT